MGQLTTHILDTANGKPGNDIPIRLFRCGSTRELLGQYRSNEDGRCDKPLLAAADFKAGTYELVFSVAEYFAGAESRDEAPFLDEITLRVTLGADQHYHVPLLVSPWSYSTYRGS